MKTFTTFFVLLTMTVAAAAGPQRGSPAGLEGDPRSVLSPLGFDVLNFVTALSAQQAGMATAGKSQAYTMTLDSLHGTSREIGEQTWFNHYRSVLVYDDFMRPVETHDYLNFGEPDGSRYTDQNGWSPLNKRVLTYNDQGLLSGLTFLLNPLQTGAMYEHLVFELYYDDFGRLDSLVTHSTTTDILVLDKTQVELFSYDEQGRTEHIEVLVWEDEAAYWRQASFKTITYDDEGKRIESGFYNIGKDKEKHLYSHDEYTYDEGGRLTGWVVSTFDYGTLQVEPYYKREFIYNEEGDHSETRDYGYVNGAWKPSALREYTYDPTIKYADVATIDFMYVLLYDRVLVPQPEDKMLSESTFSVYDDGEFIMVSRYRYFVSDKSAEADEQVTGVADLNLAAPLLYPNPAGDHITLSWTGLQERLTLEVYHITGSLVMRREVASGQRLSIDQLQTGLYLYRLTNGQSVMQAGRLMKR